MEDRDIFLLIMLWIKVKNIDFTCKLYGKVPSIISKVQHRDNVFQIFEKVGVKLYLKWP